MRSHLKRQAITHETVNVPGWDEMLFLVGKLCFWVDGEGVSAVGLIERSHGVTTCNCLFHSRF